MMPICKLHPYATMDSPVLSVKSALNKVKDDNLPNKVMQDTSLVHNGCDRIEQATENDDKMSRNITIPIYKKLKFTIYKPLIPLKLAMFIWYGAGAIIATFHLVFLKQRGMTLTEISTLYILSPLIQFIGPTICGIIADKLGRSKPVLVANLLLTIGIVICMLHVPRISSPNCDLQQVNLKCGDEKIGSLIENTNCDVSNDVIKLESCNVTCQEDIANYCKEGNLICDIIGDNEEFDILSLTLFVNWAYKSQDKCYYNVTSIFYKYTTYPWCSVPPEMYCAISCVVYPEDPTICSDKGNIRTKSLVLNIVLQILFLSFFSNTYRFIDVTSMCLVKEHDSDFGRVRFFAIAGMLTFSVLAGYIVDFSTPVGAEKNYDATFYVFIGLVCLMLCILYKLEVRIRPPGKNMWKKALQLLKNPDHIAFVLLLIVLGSAWGFTKYFIFIYLEKMDTSGSLLGLTQAFSALYGLPFLFTSNWWMKKVGPQRMFILALLGYMASGIGYSFLYNPWLALVIEFTTVFTYHLLWVAVIVYSHSIAPEGLTATVIATAGGIHYSLGKGAGGFIGGLIMENYGGRTAYRAVALVCAVCAVLYTVYLYTRKKYFKPSKNQTEKHGNENAGYEGDVVPKEIFSLQKDLEKEYVTGL